MTRSSARSARSFGQVAPDASALIESLRALGYTLEAAVADLVDNSIAAGAKVIDIVFDWNDGEPYASFTDDGRGMSAADLVEAMRLGGLGPGAERRPDDLGRYGLGLKTASFSQCMRLTVATTQGTARECARWDLHLLARSRRGWELLRGAAEGSVGRLQVLDGKVSGTTVLWEVLRTGSEGSLARFVEALERVEQHLAMVFHRYLSGEYRRLIIRLNGIEVRPWDPFITWHSATQPKPPAKLRRGAMEVLVRGFVLPHRDRFATPEEHEGAGGPDGWVSQQGFYVYRAGRLIVPGGWLGLGGSREWLRDEASQLARIRVDIDNGSDSEWRIDVKKATARPPASVRDDLIRIAVDVRRSARDVYAHRGSRGPTQPASGARSVWKATSSQRFPYSIKREHPAVQAVIDLCAEPAVVEAMLVAIEKSIPLGTSGAGEAATRHELDQLVLAARTLLRNLVALGVDMSEAVNRVAGTEPFSLVPDIASRVQAND